MTECTGIFNLSLMSTEKNQGFAVFQGTRVSKACVWQPAQGKLRGSTPAQDKGAGKPNKVSKDAAIFEYSHKTWQVNFCLSA